MPIDGSDPVANYRAIRAELEQYSPALANRPEILVLTKMDLTGAPEAADRIAAELCREPMAISAVTGRGLPALIARITELLAVEEAASPTTRDRRRGLRRYWCREGADGRRRCAIVVDIGNTRIKWGRLDEAGAIASRQAWTIASDAAGMGRGARRWAARAASAWAISSVNPPVAEALRPAGWARGRSANRDGIARRRTCRLRCESASRTAPGPIAPWRCWPPARSTARAARASSSRAGRR